MVALTDQARTIIRGLIDNSTEAVNGLRIMVQQGGCAGLQYMLGLEKAAQPGDEVFEFDGVNVYIDQASLPIVRGMRIDFVETVESAGFTFENPNVGSTCSCGKSFSS